MTNSRKIIFLFLALLLPVLIFVFLKYFGKNEFNIPIYYQTSFYKADKHCTDSIAIPYQIPSNCPVVIEGVTVVSFNEATDNALFQLTRIRSSFRDKLNVKNIVLGKDASAEDRTVLDTAMYTLAKCHFMIHGDSTTVLVDGKRRIRGYYDIQSLKDVDRLIMEVKILIDQY